MTRKKKPLPLLKDIEITGYAAEGKALARVNDIVVFVPYAVPGDVCDLQVKRKKHSFMEAEIVSISKPSSLRTEPFCQHFGVCGGCKWQHVTYEEQLRMKQQQVYDQLTRIGKVELPKFRPILGSVKTREYRNKLDFGCANKRWLTSLELKDENLEKNVPVIGFHITGAFDKILPIEKCWLMDDLHNQIRNEIRSYALQTGMTFFDLRQQTGLLRDVIIRNSNTGEWLVIVQFHLEEGGNWDGKDGKKALTLLQHVADKFPQITALMYIDNQKCNDTIGDQDILTFKGNDHIFETMEDLRFKVGPKSFYQTNTDQAYQLYCVARAFALAPMENGEIKIENYNYLKNSDNYPLSIIHYPLIYDLYTGTGTIANFVARQARQVIGIEYVPEAIEDAKVNSEINHIDNTLFYAGDMKDILNDDFIAEHGRPDIIITDPPRAGMHPDVVQTILRAAPQRIVYVSCNPATQARDPQMMDEQYKVMVVQPVDMFPHTPHVENVVLLTKRNN